MTEKKTRKTKKIRLLSLFLAATISAAAQSYPSYADTAHPNDTLPANPSHHCTASN